MPESYSGVSKDAGQRINAVVRWAEGKMNSGGQRNVTELVPDEVHVRIRPNEDPELDPEPVDIGGEEFYVADFILLNPLTRAITTLDECRVYALNGEALGADKIYMGYLVAYVEQEIEAEFISFSVVEVAATGAGGGGEVDLEVSVDGCDVHILMDGVDITGSPFNLFDSGCLTCVTMTVVTSVQCNEDDGIDITSEEVMFASCAPPA